MHASTKNSYTTNKHTPGHGRRTGRAGVVLVTSGPGCTNLVTPLATANAEGDAVVALAGNAPSVQRYKNTHQGLDNVGVMRPVSKFCAEVPAPECVAEVRGRGKEEEGGLAVTHMR